MGKKEKRARKGAQRTIVAIPSDEHCGSTIGLMPESWMNAEGQTLYPNKIQNTIRAQWLECWEFIEELICNNDTRLIVINAGDAVDGVHHGTTQLSTLRIDEMQRMHVACVAEARGLVGYDPGRGDRTFYVAGSRAHVESGAQSEEIIARLLHAEQRLAPSDPDLDDGSHLFHKLKIKINNRLFNIGHEGPSPGSRSWLKGNSLRWVLDSMYWECLEYGFNIPDYWIRAHRHQWVPPQYYSGEHGAIWGFLTPCFQAQTDWVYQKFSASEYSNIGMLIFEIDKDGNTKWHKRSIVVEQDPVLEV